jgi:hypothetical protein
LEQRSVDEHRLLNAVKLQSSVSEVNCVLQKVQIEERNRALGSDNPLLSELTAPRWRE